MKKMTKKQLDKKMEDAVSESVSKETRYALAPIKEHVIIYMWETFVKQHIYTMEYLGYSEEEAVLNLLESDNSILYFCDFCEGYAKGVRESINN